MNTRAARARDRNNKSLLRDIDGVEVSGNGLYIDIGRIRGGVVREIYNVCRVRSSSHGSSLRACSMVIEYADGSRDSFKDESAVNYAKRLEPISEGLVESMRKLFESQDRSRVSVA